MEEITTVVYKAFDGFVFKSKEECEMHETKKRAKKVVNLRNFEITFPKAIKCETRAPCDGYVVITYHKSIRKAKKYCKENNIPYQYIWRMENGG